MSNTKTNKKSKASRARKFAGILLEDKGKYFLKTKSAQLRQISRAWDCSVLCLLHGGPRVYTGPL